MLQIFSFKAWWLAPYGIHGCHHSYQFLKTNSGARNNGNILYHRWRISEREGRFSTMLCQGHGFFTVHRQSSTEHQTPKDYRCCPSYLGNYTRQIIPNHTNKMCNNPAFCLCILSKVVSMSNAVFFVWIRYSSLYLCFLCDSFHSISCRIRIDEQTARPTHALWYVEWDWMCGPWDLHVQATPWHEECDFHYIGRDARLHVDWVKSP